MQSQSEVETELVCCPNQRSKWTLHAASIWDQGEICMQPQYEVKVELVCNLNLRSCWTLYAVPIWGQGETYIQPQHEFKWTLYAASIWGQGGICMQPQSEVKVELYTSSIWGQGETCMQPQSKVMVERWSRRKCGSMHTVKWASPTTTCYKSQLPSVLVLKTKIDALTMKQCNNIRLWECCPILHPTSFTWILYVLIYEYQSPPWNAVEYTMNDIIISIKVYDQ